jgi:restriction system protein
MADEFLIPPAPPRPFIGRVAEMEQLEREVYRRERRYAEMPIVITGEAGIGKTSFAAEFVANRSRERSIWIQCRNWEMSVLPFESILRDRSIEAREAVVVLDGADEIPEPQLRELFFRVVNFKLVRTLLITSRNDLHLRGQREIRLERLPTGDSESLIKESLSISGLDERSVDKLISAVNGHPLAISLVTEMAKTMDKEHLKRVLAGHLYDLDDATPAARGGLITAAKPVIISANEAMIEALKHHPKDIFRLSPRKYEELIAELLSDMGYDVTLTKATRDGGKDILASMKTECGDILCLVEAKRYRHDRKIGVSLVRALYGTLCDFKATSGMLVTTSSYSADAQAFQQNHQYQLSLRDYTDVAGWIQQYGKTE